MNIISKIKHSLFLAGAPGVVFAMRPVLYVLFSRKRDLSEYASIDFSAYIFIAYTFLSLFVAIREIHYEKSTFYSKLFFSTNLLYFTLYSLLSFISLFWTVNILLSGFRALECVGQMLLIAVVTTRLHKEHGIQVLIEWILGWHICFAILCRVFHIVPYWGKLIYLSQMEATVYFFLALFHSSNQLFRCVIAAFSLFSTSTTSYIGMAIGSISMFWGNKWMKCTAVLISLCVIGAITLFGFVYVLQNTVFIMRSDIGLEYSSGRDKVWALAFEAARERPWTGYGFFAGEPYILYQHFTGVINAHSSFCSALLGLGYPGLILISIYIFSYIPLVFGKKIPVQYRPALLGSYTVALCHCIANPGIGSRVYGSWISVMMLFLMINVIALESSMKQHCF